MVAFADIPLVDGHAHPPLRPELAAREPFARFFTEAPFAEASTLFYRQALRELAALLDCAPTEADVLRARENDPAYLRRLVEDARIETVLLDDGYPPSGALSVAETAALAGIQAQRILRIERLAEDLIAAQQPVQRSLDDFESALLAALGAARPQLAGLKSVIAYRSGLTIEPAERDRAAASLAAVPPGRLVAKPLLDHVLQLAADWAAEQGLPLQLHTGFGDRDLDLRLANPLHLRPLLESGALARGPLVLLHTSYPYVREAAYLASVYPNVYVDLSQATPLLAGPALQHVLEELLGLAPVTRLLYGSDAWGIPDWLWLAAKAARHALEAALAWLPASEAAWVAQRILHDNAAELYGLA